MLGFLLNRSIVAFFLRIQKLGALSARGIRMDEHHVDDQIHASVLDGGHDAHSDMVHDDVAACEQL